MNEFTVAWYDECFGAKHWFGLRRVAPRDAALLLCGFDPSEPLVDGLGSLANEQVQPRDLQQMLRVFEDAIEHEQRPQSLKDWMDLAIAAGLRRHSWIDDYVAADGGNADESEKSERGNDGRSQSDIDLAELATPKQLVRAFGRATGMTSEWFRHLKDAPKLLKARKRVGIGVRSAAVPPLFCPVEVLNWLLDPKRKKGQPLTEEQGWKLLELHFEAAYRKVASVDPRE